MERPLIAVLSSPLAESRVAARGFSTLTHLFAAYAQQQLQLREPGSPQPTTTSVTLDFRDLRREGHLLSLSVLPHVLHEALSSASSLEVGVTRFLSCAQRWAEPVEQETLRHFLACLFVVSPLDENPMGELSRLVQTQHTMQHSSAERGVTPAFCASPKWMTPNTAKHYILLCDATLDDPKLCDQVFTQMCSFYGPDSCDMIRLESKLGNDDAIEGETEKEENAWAESEQYEQLLERGLERARHHAASKAQQAENASMSATQTVSTISPSYVINTIPTSTSTFLAQPTSTRRLASSDREAVQSVIEKFATKNLTAHVEKLLRTLSEQTTARRGIIGRSLTSGVKKWLQSSQNTSTQPQNNISYSVESPEMQQRRLADVAFLFGLHSFAQQHYRQVKKDFENNEAYLYQATALEMCALTTYLSHAQTRQFPIHYLENAFLYLVQYGGRYTSILRCAVNICRILIELDMPREAATLLARLNTSEIELCVAIVQSEAARCFSLAKRQRKASFYSILAANRFAKAELGHLAIACYRSCISTYVDRQWGGIERQLYASLCNDASDANSAIEFSRRLLTSSISLSEDVQKDALRTFMLIAQRSDQSKTNFTLPCPQLQGDIVVIYGETPSADSTRFHTAEWENLERASFHAVAGRTTPFRLPPLVASSSTNNRHKRTVPAGERYRLLCPLHNPLSIPLLMGEMKLRLRDVSTVDGSPSNLATIQCLTIEKLRLEPNTTIMVELSAIPHSICKEFVVDGIEMRIESEDDGISIQGLIPLQIRGQRLNNTPKEIKQMAYAKDERLSCAVVASKWPLLEMRISKAAPARVFCDQVIRITIDVENTGHEEIASFSCAIDSQNTATLAVLEGENRVSLEESVADNSQNITTFKYGHPIRVHGKIRLLFDLKAPSEECDSYSLPLMFAYKGVESQAVRHWRTQLEFAVHSLLVTQIQSLDSFSLYSLKVTNCLSGDVLARVELQQIRIISENHKGLRISSNQSIVLESGQSQALCITVGSNLPQDVQLAPALDCPNWKESQRREEEKERNLLAILWKASIINSDGQNIYLVGETLVNDPKVSTGEEDDPLGEKAVDAIQEQENQPIHFPLLATCSRITPVYHSFKEKRICEVPFSFSIANKDEQGRDALVSVRFLPKVRDSVNSLSQLAPDNRQQYMTDRSQVTARVSAGSVEKFNFIIKVWQPSVYELGGAQFIIDATVGNEIFSQKMMTSCLLIVNDSSQ